MICFYRYEHLVGPLHHLCHIPVVEEEFSLASVFNDIDELFKQRYLTRPRCLVNLLLYQNSFLSAPTSPAEEAGLALPTALHS